MKRFRINGPRVLGTVAAIDSAQGQRGTLKNPYPSGSAEAIEWTRGLLTVFGGIEFDATAVNGEQAQ